MDHHLPPRRDSRDWTHVEKLELQSLRNTYSVLPADCTFQQTLDKYGGRFPEINEVEIDKLNGIKPDYEHLWHINKKPNVYLRWLEQLSDTFGIPCPNLYFFNSDNIWGRLYAETGSIVFTCPRNQMGNQSLNFPIISHEFAHGLQRRRTGHETLNQLKSDEIFSDSFSRAFQVEGFTEADPAGVIAVKSSLAVKHLPLKPDSFELGEDRRFEMDLFFNVDPYTHPTFARRAEEALTPIDPEWAKYLERSKETGNYGKALIEYCEARSCLLSLSTKNSRNSNPQPSERR